MPQVKYTPEAIADLRRLEDFLRPANREAARRASEAIRNGVRLLGKHPEIGRMVEDLPDIFREWIIEFGDSGYVVRYAVADAIIILAIRHQKEAGMN